MFANSCTNIHARSEFANIYHLQIYSHACLIRNLLEENYHFHLWPRRHSDTRCKVLIIATEDNIEALHPCKHQALLKRSVLHNGLAPRYASILEDALQGTMGKHKGSRALHQL